MIDLNDPSLTDSDRRTLVFLADLTVVCQRHGLTLDLVADAPPEHPAHEVLANGRIALVPCELHEHTSAGEGAHWQLDNAGSIWWQP